MKLTGPRRSRRRWKEVEGSNESVAEGTETGWKWRWRKNKEWKVDEK